jgi:3-dehydroquinate dehydratase-2
VKVKILLLHGPNLNLLGEREPEIYGTLTLPQLNRRLRDFAKDRGVTLKIFQSNYEGGLIDLLHRYRKWADGVVINPGAYTHYSYALRDGIASISKPTVEVHLSDLQKREEFRRISVIAPVCVRQISGLGWKSYIEGIQFIQMQLYRGAAKEMLIKNDHGNESGGSDP